MQLSTVLIEIETKIVSLDNIYKKVCRLKWPPEPIPDGRHTRQDETIKYFLNRKQSGGDRSIRPYSRQGSPCDTHIAMTARQQVVVVNSVKGPLTGPRESKEVTLPLSLEEGI